MRYAYCALHLLRRADLAHPAATGRARRQSSALRAQSSELSLRLCVADSHGDLKAPGIAIALDQISAYALRLQLHARLLTAARLPAALLATLLRVLKVLVCLCTRPLTSGGVALLARAPAEFCLTRRQPCPFRNV